MHNSGQCCKLLRFSPLDKMPLNIADFLEQTFEVVSVNYTDNGQEEYVCYAPLDFNEETFLKQFQEKFPAAPTFQTEVLENKNWLTENVIKFPPFEIGSFMVYGIHETSCPPTKKIPVQVYAATAFGSEHQTTKMCLETISELHQIIKAPQKILDMGTGSGILSIAAAKIWNKTPKIIAADIDSESVDVTANNAITNNVEECMYAILSDGYTNPEITRNAPYDLIFANILANPLKEMRQSAYEALKTGGYYLISGFIEPQEDDIITSHRDCGFELVKICRLENWRAALLKK